MIVSILFQWHKLLISRKSFLCLHLLIRLCPIFYPVWLSSCCSCPTFASTFGGRLANLGVSSFPSFATFASQLPSSTLRRYSSSSLFLVGDDCFHSASMAQVIINLTQVLSSFSSSSSSYRTTSCILPSVAVFLLFMSNFRINVWRPPS